MELLRSSLSSVAKTLSDGFVCLFFSLNKEVKHFEIGLGMLMAAFIYK